MPQGFARCQVDPDVGFFLARRIGDQRYGVAGLKRGKVALPPGEDGSVHRSPESGGTAGREMGSFGLDA